MESPDMLPKALACVTSLLFAAFSFAAEAPPKKSEPAKADAAKSATKGKPPEKEMEHLDVWAENIVYEGGNPPETKEDAKKRDDAKGVAKKDTEKKEEPKKAAATLEKKPGKFHCTGNVTVIRGTMRVDCDVMDGDVDAKTREVSRVIATGAVRLLTVAAVGADPNGKPRTDAVAQDAWRATCDKADYDVKADRMLMTCLPGKPRPRLWRDKGYGEADSIIFSPNKGEYELIGDPVLRGEMPAGPAHPSEKAPPAE